MKLLNHHQSDVKLWMKLQITLGKCEACASASVHNTKSNITHVQPFLV